MNTYYYIIAVSLIIILSFLFNIIAKRTKIPSVLMLMVLGLLIHEGTKMMGIPLPDFESILPLLGNVGLIMIVLEAALDLELKRDKWPIIWKSMLVALLGLLGCAFVIAFILQQFITDMSFIKAFLYATPLSIMSSAIIIPSVGGLSEDKKEFMVYESTFSDILGIMLFYFLKDNYDAENVTTVVFSILGNIAVTMVLSIVVAYGLVYIFQKLTSQVKLFLIIAVLMLLFALGKLFHLSSLITILVFGLVLNNTELFFMKRLRKYIRQDIIKPMLHDFHTLTLETAFVIRTFFFVTFGLTISLAYLFDVRVALISASILAGIYLIRYVILKVILVKDITTPLMIAPRGLITILLFFAIPRDKFPITDSQYAMFEGVLLFVILISSVLMALALMLDRGEKVKDIFRDSIPRIGKGSSATKAPSQIDNKTINHESKPEGIED